MAANTLDQVGKDTQQVYRTKQEVAPAFRPRYDATVAKVRDALLGGFAQSRILDLHGKRILERNFEPGFRVELHRKDRPVRLDSDR